MFCLSIIYHQKLTCKKFRTFVPSGMIILGMIVYKVFPQTIRNTMSRQMPHISSNSQHAVVTAKMIMKKPISFYSKSLQCSTLFVYIRYTSWTVERERRLVGSDPWADEPESNSATASFVKRWLCFEHVGNCCYYHIVGNRYRYDAISFCRASLLVGGCLSTKQWDWR